MHLFNRTCCVWYAWSDPLRNSLNWLVRQDHPTPYSDYHYLTLWGRWQERIRRMRRKCKDREKCEGRVEKKQSVEILKYKGLNKWWGTRCKTHMGCNVIRYSRYKFIVDIFDEQLVRQNGIAAQTLFHTSLDSLDTHLNLHVSVWLFILPASHLNAQHCKTQTQYILFPIPLLGNVFGLMQFRSPQTFLQKSVRLMQCEFSV